MELSRRDEGLIDMAEAGQAIDDAMTLTCRYILIHQNETPWLKRTWNAKE